jgi:hypothetical protein
LTVLTFELDPALKLCMHLHTYVSQASIIFPLDGRSFVHGGGSCECGVLLDLHVIDEGEAELSLDVFLESIDPWFWGAGTSRRDGLWHC